MFSIPIGSSYILVKECNVRLGSMTGFNPYGSGITNGRFRISSILVLVQVSSRPAFCNRWITSYRDSHFLHTCESAVTRVLASNNLSLYWSTKRERHSGGQVIRRVSDTHTAAPTKQSIRQFSCCTSTVDLARLPSGEATQVDTGPPKETDVIREIGYLIKHKVD